MKIIPFTLRKDLKKQMEEYEAYADELMEDLMDLPAGMIKDKIGDAALKYGSKVAVAHASATLVCGAGGAAAGSIVPVVGTVAVGVTGAAVCNVGAAIFDVASGLYTLCPYGSIAQL